MNAFVMEVKGIGSGERERDKRSGRATGQTQHTYSCISVVISPQQGAWRELN